MSRRGSNAINILHAINTRRLSATVPIVICNNPHSSGINVIRDRGIPTQIIVPTSYDSVQAYERDIRTLLTQHGVDVVILAGYMKRVESELLEAFNNRILNIHPSLLPSFKGLHAQRQALDYGVKFSGCTVHMVNEAIDSGRIVSQAVVPVASDDTVETLSARILKEEHRIYPEAIQDILTNLTASSPNESGILE